MAQSLLTYVLIFGILAVQLAVAPFIFSFASDFLDSIKYFDFSTSIFDLWLAGVIVSVAISYCLIAVKDIAFLVHLSVLVVVVFASIKAYFFHFKGAFVISSFILSICGVLLSYFLFCIMIINNSKGKEKIGEEVDFYDHFSKKSSLVNDNEDFYRILSDEINDVENGSPNENDSTHVPTYSKMLDWIKPDAGLILIATIALAVSTACGLAQPYYFGLIIETVASPVATNEEHSSNYKIRRLNEYSLLLFIFFLIGGISSWIRGWIYTLVGEKVVQRLRIALFRKIVLQDISFFDDNKTGDLTNRLSSDTATLQSALSVNVSMGLRSGAQVLFCLLFLVITSWKLTLVMAAVVPVLLVVVGFYGQYVQTKSRQYQDALARASEVSTETLSNARVMRSFGAEQLECARYEAGVNTSYQRGASKAMAYGVFIGGASTVAGGAVIAVVFYGARLVVSHQMSTGELTAFILYTVYLTMGLGTLSSLYTELVTALGASQRIFEILNTEPSINLCGGGIWPTPNTVQGHVSFKDVGFAYATRPDVEVLDNFNMEVLPKQMVALVGVSGAGKSTVLALLQRHYDVKRGSISIDGRDIRYLDPIWLHRAVSVVPQDPVLFSGTIRENIGYARFAAVDSDIERIKRKEAVLKELERRWQKKYSKTDMISALNNGDWATLSPQLTSQPTDEEIQQAARLANAHDFITQLPEGYNTLVGERGIRLSGGQRQRIAIARALLADPAILLLDEATSALDSESEALVQEAISRLMTHRTVIVVAHRLSTVRNADCILQIGRGGRVVAKGTHNELVRTSPQYLRLVQKQMNWSESARSPIAEDGEEIISEVTELVGQTVAEVMDIETESDRDGLNFDLTGDEDVGDESEWKDTDTKGSSAAATSDSPAPAEIAIHDDTIDTNDEITLSNI